mgnify:CR=1 FL=1
MSVDLKTPETGQDAERDDERDDERKTRQCLVCKDSFLSEWAGERICRKCKQRAEWRNG